MSSQRKLDAARANGALARGRKTPEGKARSAQNALRHGLLAQCVLLEGEASENFDQLAAQFADRFRPRDGVEEGLLEEMVSAFWRSRRAWTIETQLMDNAMHAQPHGSPRERLATAFASLAAEPQLPLLHRYEARLHGMFQRALRNLIALRNLELPNHANPISEHSAPPAVIPPADTLPTPTPTPTAPCPTVAPQPPSEEAPGPCPPTSARRPPARAISRRLAARPRRKLWSPNLRPALSCPAATHRRAPRFPPSERLTLCKL